MTAYAPKLSCDQVLELFAMERDADRKTLQRYLQEYPEYSLQLVDISSEIFRLGIQDEGPLLVENQMRINSAWSRIQNATSKATADPFAQLSVFESRKVAQALKIPRQVITAFRERSVIVASVPKRFLAQLADLVGSSYQGLLYTLSLPPQQLARSYKADIKPTQAEQVTFEQLLRDAGLSDEQIELLLADEA